MNHIDDHKHISQLSVPGTHDTAACHEYQPMCTLFCECQSLKIPDQLNIGVRFLDIRLNHYENYFRINHGFIYLKLNFADVLNDIDAFLRQNPSESIVMRYKKEYEEIDCSRSFVDTLQSYIGSYPGYRFPLHSFSFFHDLCQIVRRNFVAGNEFFIQFRS